MIKFSVIIPTYNRSNFIGSALDSVLEQTYPTWECIVVDDGSTDDTAHIVQSYSEQDERIRYIYQENAERSAARNKGILNADGEWICFLDSDDLYEPNYLSELTLFIASINGQSAMIISDYNEYNGKEKKSIQTHSIDSKHVSNYLFIHPVSPTRCCVHHEILKIFQFDERICIVEDTVLWVSISSKHQIFQLEKPLVSYRIHENNSVAQYSGSIFNRYKGLRLFFTENLSRNVSTSVKRRMLSEAEFRIAEFYCYQRRKFKAFQWAIKSLITQWNHEQLKMRIFFVISMVPIFNFFWQKRNKHLTH